MSVRRIASAMAAMVLMGSTLVAGAGSASANQVWYQSVDKASAEAPCPTSTGTELAVGWTQWSSSWAMWANQGRGGFVCNREITWAYSETTPTPAGPTCVLANTSPFNVYVNFAGSNKLTSFQLYSDAGCNSTVLTPFNYTVVYAPSNVAAKEVCGPSCPSVSTPIFAREGSNIWQCNDPI